MTKLYKQKIDFSDLVCFDLVNKEDICTNAEDFNYFIELDNKNLEQDVNDLLKYLKTVDVINEDKEENFWREIKFIKTVLIRPRGDCKIVLVDINELEEL